MPPHAQTPMTISHGVPVRCGASDGHVAYVKAARTRRKLTPPCDAPVRKKLQATIRKLSAIQNTHQSICTGWPPEWATVTGSLGRQYLISNTAAATSSATATPVTRCRGGSMVRSDFQRAQSVSRMPAGPDVGEGGSSFSCTSRKNNQVVIANSAAPIKRYGRTGAASPQPTMTTQMSHHRTRSAFPVRSNHSRGRGIGKQNSQASHKEKETPSIKSAMERQTTPPPIDIHR